MTHDSEYMKHWTKMDDEYNMERIWRKWKDKKIV